MTHHKQTVRQIVVILLIAALAAMVFQVSFAGSVFGPYRLTNPIAVDGDTIKAEVNIWPDHFVLTRVRVKGIDTPEIKGKCASEKAAAAEAKRFVQSFIESFEPITISNVTPDPYPGRVDADIFGRNNNSLAVALLAAGHARPSDAKKGRQSWCAL